MKNKIKLASLIALIILDCLPANAEWIDKTGNVFEGPVEMHSEPHRSGEWVIRPRFLTASPFHDGKALVTIAGTEFSTVAWNNHDPLTGYIRERQFQIFLARHHLLGLSKDSVQKYLGSPNSSSDNLASYTLESNCTTSLNVELFLLMT